MCEAASGSRKRKRGVTGLGIFEFSEKETLGQEGDQVERVWQRTQTVASKKGHKSAHISERVWRVACVQMILPLSPEASLHRFQANLQLSGPWRSLIATPKIPDVV